MVPDGDKRYFLECINIINIHMNTNVFVYAEHKYHV